MTITPPIGEEPRRCLEQCVGLYEKVAGGIDATATEQNERAYGGVVRMTKGNNGGRCRPKTPHRVVAYARR